MRLARLECSECAWVDEPPEPVAPPVPRSSALPQSQVSFGPAPVYSALRLERLRPGVITAEMDPLIGEKRIWFWIYLGIEALATLSPIFIILYFHHMINGMSGGGAGITDDPQIRIITGLIILVCIVKFLGGLITAALYYWILFSQQHWPKIGCLIFKGLGFIFGMLSLAGWEGRELLDEALPVMGLWIVPLLILGIGFEAWLLAILTRDIYARFNPAA